MQIMRQEGRKLFFHQRIAIWLVLIILLKILSAYHGAEKAEPNLPEEYPAYFRMLGGKVTEEKRKRIDKRYQSLSTVPGQINHLEDDYESGKISQREYLKRMANLSRIKKEERCIKLFYNRYEYACKDIEHRYIVQDAAWEELLAKERLDFLLVLFLFLMTVPLFCEEYQSEMQTLQVCSVGRRAVPAVKMILAAGVALLVSFLFSVIEYIAYTCHLGGEYSHAPIQSLEFFEESSLPFSFLELWGLQTVCKMAGAVFLVLVIMAISVVAKKSLLTVIGSVLTVVIPAAISNMPKMKYVLPFPAGLLYGNGYFFPDQYDYDLSETDAVEKIVTFKAFSWREIPLLGILFLLCMVLLAYFSIRRYQNKAFWGKFAVRRYGRANGKMHMPHAFMGICMILLPLLSGICLSSCGLKESEEKEIFYEYSTSADELINQRYRFTLEDNNILIHHLDTGEETYLLRDVFVQAGEGERYELSAYLTEDYLYYAKDTERELLLYKVNLSDFSSECIYQKECDAVNVCYDLELVSPRGFYVYDIFSQENYFIDWEGGDWTRIDAASSLYAAEYGDVVYYEDMESHIACYDVRTGKKKVFSDIVIRSGFSTISSAFYIYGDLCFYNNMLDHDDIYCYHFSTGENELFMKKEKAKTFWCDDVSFYYTDADGRVMERNLETGEERMQRELGE